MDEKTVHETSAVVKGLQFGPLLSCGWENPHTPLTLLLWWQFIVCVSSADNKGGITSSCGYMCLLYFPLPCVNLLVASQGDSTALGC